VPSLLERTLTPPNGGPLLQLYISGYNTVFLFVLAAFFYGVVRSCAACTALPLSDFCLLLCGAAIMAVLMLACVGAHWQLRTLFTRQQCPAIVILLSGCSGLRYCRTGWPDTPRSRCCRCTDPMKGLLFLFFWGSAREGQCSFLHAWCDRQLRTPESIVRAHIYCHIRVPASVGRVNYIVAYILPGDAASCMKRGCCTTTASTGHH
jgi:hypothetical protein